MKAIDLFSGCGGFSIGFLQSGFEIIKAVEFDKTIAKTYIIMLIALCLSIIVIDAVAKLVAQMFMIYGVGAADTIYKNEEKIIISTEKYPVIEKESYTSNSEDARRCHLCINKSGKKVNNKFH